MFRLDAQSTEHFPTVGSINPASRQNRHKKQDQNQDAQRFGHPVIERIIFRTRRHNSTFKEILENVTLTIWP